MKEAKIQFYQNRCLRWYLPLTLNGRELPEIYAPHFTDCDAIEWFGKLVGKIPDLNKELNTKEK